MSTIKQIRIGTAYINLFHNDLYDNLVDYDFSSLYPSMIIGCRMIRKSKKNNRKSKRLLRRSSKLIGVEIVKIHLDEYKPIYIDKDNNKYSIENKQFKKIKQPPNILARTLGESVLQFTDKISPYRSNLKNQVIEQLKKDEAIIDKLFDCSDIIKGDV